ARPAATLRRSLGRAPAYAEVRDALCASLAELEEAPEPLDPGEADAFARPHREKFASAQWTWRR
ncbi:MAG TPA: hypothetical protein VFE70_08795, partial [Candidatus Elarobacter sp.]|nr:hypothetical protein [Candidatus Elarobacter sp.]